MRASPRDVVPHLLLVVFAISWNAIQVDAATLPPQIQLGTVAVDQETGARFARAIVLDVPADRVHLESSSDALWLEPIDEQSTRCVLAPRRPGPVSGRLTLEIEGTTRHALIAGEAIEAPRSQWPAILMRLRDAQDPTVHAVRFEGMPAARSVRLATRSIAMTPPNASGWQALPLSLEGRESRGRLVQIDGSDGPAVQLSALEAVTLLARDPLPAGVDWSGVLALRERIGSRGLEARLLVRGRTQQERRIRILQLGSNGESPTFRRIGTIAVPRVEQLGLRARLLPLRTADGTSSLRKRRILRFAGERARLLDTTNGVLDARQSRGLFFTGAATTSRLNADRAFAVRRDLQTGERYLRRWTVARTAKDGRLVGRRLRPSLEEILRTTPERIYDAAITIDPTAWPVQALRERILVLGRDDSVPRLWSIGFDAAQGRLTSAQRRWIGEVQIPADGPAPSLRRLGSRLTDSRGLPAGIRVHLPAVQAVRILEQRAFGQRFTNLPGTNLNSRGASLDGLALEPRRFLRLDVDGQGRALLGRYAVTPNGLAPVSGRLIEGETTPIDLRRSTRRRQAFALTGKIGERFLRLFDLGLAGTSVPPRIDVGADLRLRAASGEGAFVDLRARVRDADGDPLALRWSAPGIRFDDASARQVRAFFPVGTTQVRARVRERLGRALGKAGAYQATDLLNVTVEAATATPPTTGLRTAIAGVFPNPANPSSRVAFSLERGGSVRLDVVDSRGRHVRTLLHEHRTAGAWDVNWNGLDDTGQPVASGVYHVQLRADGRRDTARVTLVK